MPATSAFSANGFLSGLRASLGYPLLGTADVLGDSLVLTSSLIALRESRVVVRRHLKRSNDPNAYFDAIEALIADTFGTLPRRQRPEGAVALKGRLEVTSEPPGAIILDGRPTGQTSPTVLADIDAGSHRLRVSDGSRSGEATVLIVPGELTTVHVPLTTGLTGSIRIDATVPGARVYFGDRELGLSPQLVRDVPVGQYPVRVVASQRIPYEEEVRVTSDGLTTLTADLAPAREHRFVPFTSVRTWRRPSDDETAAVVGLGLSARNRLLVGTPSATRLRRPLQRRGNVRVSGSGGRARARQLAQAVALGRRGALRLVRCRQPGSARS